MAEENITTKFKVDVSDLKAGIKEANQQMKLANAEFKKTSASMDDWSKSSTGITAKLKQLDSVLAAQKSKLSNYKEQLDRQEQAYKENGKRAEMLRAKLQELADKGVSKTSAEYKKYQAELTACEKEQMANEKAIKDLNITILNQEAAVNKTEKEMGDLTQELDRVEQAEKEAARSGKTVDQALKEMDGATKKADKGFTVLRGTMANLAAQGISKVADGVRNLGRAMFDAWRDYDKGADIIIQKTGATGKAAEGLKSVYKSVSKSVVGDFEELGTAVGEVNTRFGVTGKDLEKLSTQFLKFAKLNGVDVNDAIDKSQGAMAAWNVKAKDAGKFLDTLNKAGQDTGVNVNTLAEQMKKLAPSLKSMGLNASDAAMFIANLDKNGVDAQSAMAGLKKGLVNAAKEGKPMSTAMADTEKAIKGAKTEAEAITIASEMFGSKAGASIAKAVREGKLSFSELGTSMSDFKGNVNKTFEDTLEAPDKFKLVIQKIRTEMADTAGRFAAKYEPQITAALKTIGKIISALFKGIDKLMGFVTKNGDAIIAVITGIAAATAAYLAYTTALNIMTKGWKALTIATKAEAAAQRVLNVVMSANPIGLIIAAVAALIAIFIVLWKKSEGFRQFWLGLWEKIKGAVKPVIDALKKWFTEAWETIKAVWAKVAPYFKAIWEAIKKVFSVVVAVLGGFFKAAWTAIKTVWSIAVAFFKGVWNGIKLVFSVVAAVLKGFFSAAWNGIKAIWSVVVAFFKGVWNGIKQVFSAVASWFGDKFRAAWNAVKSAFSAVKSWFSARWNDIKGVFKGVASWFGNIFSNAWSAIKAKFSGWANFWKGLWGKIKNTFKGLGTKIGDAIGGAVKAGINKVISGAESIINKAIGLINGAIGIINKLPGVKIGKIGKVNFPRLEQGGILRKGQVGLLEGSGAEAVVPLDKNKRWIHRVAQDLKEDMKREMQSSMSKTVNNNKSQVFNQNIYAPKTPSRIELYRQTRNLLSLAKEGL